MFKNKYLKQLQDVQVRIRDCKIAIANLDAPEPRAIAIGIAVRKYIDSLTLRLKPDISKFFMVENEVYDYLRQLGEYFINIADYEKNKKTYTAELEQLQKEEHILKEKLGID